jgi:hypothetical protein
MSAIAERIVLAITTFLESILSFSGLGVIFAVSGRARSG